MAPSASRDRKRRRANLFFRVSARRQMSLPRGGTPAPGTILFVGRAQNHSRSAGTVAWHHDGMLMSTTVAHIATALHFPTQRMRRCSVPLSMNSLLVLPIAFLWIATASVTTPQAGTALRNGAGDAPSLKTPFIGESALVDKETGRIFWKGGSRTSLSESIAPLMGELGLRHVRATALSSLLLLAGVSNLVAWLRQQLEASSWGSADSWQVKTLLFSLNWTILRIPKMGSGLVAVGCLLYLLESNGCSTRRYLTNAMSSPEELEEYVESLREAPPVVTWKVRCFHYERRKWLSILMFGSIWSRIFRDRHPSSTGTSPSLLTKKVVTHHASGNYTFNSFQDCTVVGVWKRAESTSVTLAPFTKIVLSKLLVLSNAKAREDYFKQQSDFVTQEGQADEYAEFSTNIHVDGFQSRTLAVRPVEGQPSAKLFRLNLFWLFTFLGLTVPFRVWFARHCDELRVTVAKETSASKSSKSWFKWSSKSEDSPMEGFKRVMQELALYTSVEARGKPINSVAQELMNDIEVSAASAVELNDSDAMVTNATMTSPMTTSERNPEATTVDAFEGVSISNNTTCIVPSNISDVKTELLAAPEAETDENATAAAAEIATAEQSGPQDHPQY